jgi:hypothetical protein
LQILAVLLGRETEGKVGRAEGLLAGLLIVVKFNMLSAARQIIVRQRGVREK